MWMYKYPRKSFCHQLFSAWALTLLVIVIISMGLFFSIRQLNYALKVGDISSLETELAIEKAGRISIRSSVIGGTVLIASIVFFLFVFTICIWKTCSISNHIFRI